MKKTISLLLALMLCLPLCACSKMGSLSRTKQTITKEEMLETAQILDYNVFAKALSDNIVNAKSNYENQIYMATGIVTDITEKYILMDNYRVYLSVDDISEIKKDQYITVVGTLTNLDDNFMKRIVDFENGYLVTTIFEETGTIVNKTSLSGVSYYIILTKDGREIAVTLNPDSNHNVKVGDLIVVEGCKRYERQEFWPISNIIMENATLK